ncbi:MAG: hypothetical protein JKX68_07135 [Flavobacteriales bacterium]|nr:hypothetical protein [Flavobacteriales bacterium]
MKKLVLLIVLLPQLSLLFGQNDSITPKKNKPKNNFKYSIGVDIVKGPSESYGEYFHSSIGQHLYGGYSWGNHTVFIGITFGKKLDVENIRTDIYTFSRKTLTDYSLKGGMLGYRFTPKILAPIFIEYRFNFYKERYISDIVHRTYSQGTYGTDVTIFRNETDINATVLNNSIGIGITSNPSKRISINTSFSFVFVNYFSIDYQAYEDVPPYFKKNETPNPFINTPSWQTKIIIPPQFFTCYMLKVGVKYNFHKREK